jgi:hypothetical protein
MYTLQGKTRPTRHMLSTVGQCMALDHTYLTWFACSNLLWVINRVGWMHYSEEKVLPTLSLSLAEWPMGPALASLPT